MRRGRARAGTRVVRDCEWRWGRSRMRAWACPRCWRRRIAALSVPACATGPHDECVVLTPPRSVAMFAHRFGAGRLGMNAWVKCLLLAATALLTSACSSVSAPSAVSDVKECVEILADGLRPLAAERDQ